MRVGALSLTQCFKSHFKKSVHKKIRQRILHISRKRVALKRTVVELRILLPHEFVPTLPQEWSVFWNIRNRLNR